MIFSYYYPDETPPPKPEKHCAWCSIELCELLDAYWGKDPFIKQLCITCRKKFEK